MTIFTSVRGLFKKAPKPTPQPAYKKPLPSLQIALQRAAAKPRVRPESSEDEPLEPRHTIQMRLEELQEKGFLPPMDEDHKISNEFRALKRAIMARLPGRNPEAEELSNILMVTSSLPGEGKTTCAMNLALAIALEQDYTVVLIDGDVVNPTISKTLGIDKEPGLLDALRDPKISLSDLEIGTGLPALRVIPAGHRGVDAPELLSSNRMTMLIEEMSKQTNRIFIFDSTPVLLTNECRALSEMIGQIAFVVRAGSTPRAAVKAALSFMPEDIFLGLILNNKSNRGQDDYYYAYGSYYMPFDEDEESAVKA